MTGPINRERAALSVLYLRYLRGQDRFPFFPWEEIRRFQTARLRRMVGFAYREVPYYRRVMDRLGVRPRDVRSVEDLDAWPILGSTDLQQRPHDLVRGGRPSEGWTFLRSGGSMGEPKTIWVAIVPAAGSDRGRIAEEIEQRFRSRFGSGTVAEIEFVEELERTPGGKVRAFVSQAAGQG